MRQLLLDFTRAPAPTFANYVHGGNAELFHALRSAVDGRLAERVLYMWGEPGAGKTHLVESFRAAADAQRLASGRVRAIDGIEDLSPEAQAALFNDFIERAFDFLLVSARSAPADLAIRRDLATRLATGLTFRVLPLTDAQKREALQAHARARGFELTGEVASYLLNHTRRDMGSLMSALDALDRYSLETGRLVTVPLLKAAMQS